MPARDWSEETFLTVQEVADRLRLNQQTIRNMIDDGRLPALRVGRRVRILQSDLDQFLVNSYTGRQTDGANPSPEQALE